MLEIFEKRKADIEQLLHFQPVLKNQEDRINLAFMRASLESHLLLYTDSTQIKSDDPAVLQAYLESFRDECIDQANSRRKAGELQDSIIASSIAIECGTALSIMKEAGLIC